MTGQLSERLKEARKSLGLNATEMAALVGLKDRKSWEHYEREETSPRSEVLSHLVKRGIDANWILTGEGRMHRRQASLSDNAVGELAGHVTRGGDHQSERALPQLGRDFVLVPRYDVEASAGAGALTVAENVVDYMAFQEGWVRRTLGLDPERLALISAKGDSMEPTIRAGDLLLIDTSVIEVEDDAIYILVMDGHLMVKRLQRFVGGVVAVKSDNAAYVEQTLNAADLASHARIAGRVRWIGRLT
jgi:phage repressor protein C with HTH and peptisase S24 domain